MGEDDPSTIISRRTGSGLDGGDLRALAPALTILWHYDLRRVGETSALGLGRTEVSRYTAPFDPVTDAVLSRSPFFHVDHREGTIIIKPAATKTSVTVDGLPLVDARHVAPEQLQRGVIIVLGDAIVVCLHRLRTPVLRGPAFGLVGNSDIIEGVRRQIRKVADLDVPVLIRGETGTGKELVATAIALTSKTPDPFVTVNMATIGSTMAASDLFGHEKGAFTGASEARPGHFADADGGTLFMDEIGATPIDVQRMLLRVLETGEVRALGSRRVRKVKVRLLTATDADLEGAVARGTFDGPLFHRLEGYRIVLPALRDRREDIGSLFVHFLRRELEATGELDRLEPCDASERPWLDALAFARIALAAFPGNLRRLHSVARQVVISSRGQPFAQLDSIVDQLLAGADLAVAARVTSARRAGQPTDEEIQDALRRHNFNRAAAAVALGIHRSTLYERVRAAPGAARTADTLSDDEILQAHDRHQGNVASMAAELQVSPKRLKHRLVDVLARKRSR